MLKFSPPAQPIVDSAASRPLRRRQTLLALVVLVGLPLIFIWPSVLGSKIFLPLDILPHIQPWRYSYERVVVNNPNNSDVVEQIYPRRLLATQIARAGAWPLWNPTILTGTPLLADGQLAFFYPPSLLFLVLPLSRAFGVYAYLQLILSGSGSFLFARRIGLRLLPALLTGVCVMLSGFALGWLQFPEFSGATAMLPWCFWAVDRAFARRSVSGWLLAGAVLAMPLLAQLQIALYAYVGAGCLALVRIAQAPDWRARRWTALSFGGALLLALGLGAVQLLPQLELAAAGQRPDMQSPTAPAAEQFQLLLRTVLPLVGGAPRAGAVPDWTPPLFQTPLPYVGLIALLLAAVALLRSRDPLTPLFALLAIVSFALAISSPALRVLLALVPPYRQFSDHTRWCALWAFAMAVLGGIGAQSLGERRSAPTGAAARIAWLNRAILGALVLGLGGATLAHLQLFQPDSLYGQYITTIRAQPLHVPLIVGGLGAATIALGLLGRVPRALPPSLLLVLAAGDLLWYGASYNTQSSPSLFLPTTELTADLAALGGVSQPTALYPPTRQTTLLQQQPGPFRILGAEYGTLPPNLSGAVGLEDVRGYQSLYMARYNRLVRLIDGKDPAHLGESDMSIRAYMTSAYSRRRLLDMLNVQYLLFPPGSTVAKQFGPLELLQQSDEGTLYRNPRALPRAWLVHQAEVLPTDAEQLARLADPAFDPAVRAILPTAPPALGPSTAAEPAPVITYGPNTARVTASATAPALLIVSDAYAEGWSATVDGVRAPIYRANYALRGVWLPAGDHTVVFRYAPRPFAAGLALSGITLGGLLGAAAWALVRRRRPRLAPAE